jgi:murein L,D-transpeptidase YafK
MRFIFGILICYSLSFANFIELYRTQGIYAVKKEFDKLMRTKTYWDKYLKSQDVRYGYYESIDSVLVCNKNEKKLFLYKKNNKHFEQKFSSSVFIGKKEGDKQKEGDLKTPVGVYDLTQRLTKLDLFYGPLALVTSYPNLYDKIQNKNGSGIWIHGLPTDEKRDDFTKGCVALDNDKLETLNSKINYKKTVLLLNENKIKYVKKSDISNILYQIYVWKDAWEKGDIKKYLTFYDKSFLQLNGRDFEKFKERKYRIFKRTKNKQISFKNINISPYPNTKNKSLFKISMDEDYRAKYYKFKGKKILYIELKNNGKISILTES